MRDRRDVTAWLAAAALLLVALVSYANAFQNPFFFDDYEGIVENTHVRHLWPLTDALGAPRQSVAAGRPVVALSLALNYAWGELAPAGYHTLNLLVLWLSAVTLFVFLRRAFRLPSVAAWLQRDATLAAGVIATIWLLHPLQTEVVNYVVQRTESMMGLFYLLTMYAALRVMIGGGPRWTASAIAACVLGMATKEAMVTAPVMVLAFDAVFVGGSPVRAVRERMALYGGLAASWIVLAALNIAGPRARSAGLGSGISPLTYLWNQGGIILEYLKRVVWPHPLIADYGMTPQMTFADAAPAVAVVALLLIATLFVFSKRPRAAFPALWFFVTLAPASSFVPIATEVGAERRMYLPLAGLLTLIVVGMLAVFVRVGVDIAAPRVRRAIVAGIAILCAAASATTYQRNRDYSDHARLWGGIVSARPTGRAYYNLGLALKDRGDVAGAMSQYQEAAARGHWEALYAIGFEHDHAGRLPQAIAAYRNFLSSAGEDFRVPPTYVLLGRALARDGHPADAEAAYRRALSMRPQYRDAQAGLGDVLLDAGRFAEAADVYRDYVTAVQNNADAYTNLGKALIGLDRVAEAVDAFAHAVALSPTPTTRLNYGMSLVSSARFDEAIAQYQQALAASPTNVPLLSALGVAYALKGQRSEAIDAFTRAYRLDPTNPQMRDDFRTVFGIEPRMPTEGGTGRQDRQGGAGR